MSPDRLDIELSGGCQCGAVRYHATELRTNPHVCYCRMCQKATGGLGAALVGVLDEHLTWTRGSPAVFRSSEHVERGFCADCGTPLFYHYDGGPHHSMTVGSFDDPHRIPILYEMGLEGRHPALVPIPSAEQCGTTADNDGPDNVGKIAASNRQHPDHDTTEWTPQLSGV